MRGKVTTPSGVWKLKLPQDLESLILFPLGTVGFPGGSAGKESTCNAGHHDLVTGLGRSTGEGKKPPTPVFWPGEFHGLYSPWDRKQSDTTE